MTDRDIDEARNEMPAEPPAADKPPHLDESVRRIGKAGRATLDSALDTGRAMRRLVFADLALARSSLGRALAWVAVAIVFGASAWLLVMGVMIATLRAFDWSWLAAFSLCAAANLAITAVAAWRVATFFDHAGMHATRRQLARFGVADEPGDDNDDDTPMPSQAPAPQPAVP